MWNVSWGSLRYLSLMIDKVPPPCTAPPLACPGPPGVLVEPGFALELPRNIIRSGWITPLIHRMKMVLVPEQDQVATVEESWPASNEDETVQASGSLVPWEPWCQFCKYFKFSCPPPTTFMGGNMTVLKGHPGILRVHLLVLQEWYATPLWLNLTLPAEDPHWSS